MSNTVPTSSALRALALEYKSLQEEPVEGFRVKLLGEDNLFEWEVAIFGPPDTLYQGGYFKVRPVMLHKRNHKKNLFCSTNFVNLTLKQITL
jgi:ubiquitin-conjugating enzyme E2 R